MSFPLVVVVGPTGSGKSTLALELAERFQGEIVGCDSVQVYKRFDIGTAKLSKQQQKGIPHHLIDLIEPDQLFTAGEYARLGRNILKDIRSRNRLPIIAGGTGLYLTALLEGLFEGPRRSESLRSKLQKLEIENGPAYLHHLLAELDPPSALRISPNDKAKLVRALEVFFLSDKPLSEHLRNGRDPLKDFVVLKIGLNPHRKLLYQAIDLRVEQMFNEGFVEEVESLLARGFSYTQRPFQSLGYAQIVAYLQEKINLREAIASTQRETRRYAKRQMTWFRRDKEIRWYCGFGSDEMVHSQVFQEVAEFFKPPIRRSEAPRACGLSQMKQSDRDAPMRGAHLK